MDFIFTENDVNLLYIGAVLNNPLLLNNKA